MKNLLCSGKIIFNSLENWLPLGCIAFIGVLSFSAPKISDLFLAILVCFGGFFWLRSCRAVTLPLVLAIVWMVFVVCVAIHATIAGVPGRHLAQIAKHLPLALGPIVAVTFAAITRRCGFGLIFSVFLAALVSGSCVVLIWNGGLEIVPLVFRGHLPNATNLGGINRNFAALSAGIGLISALAIIGNEWISPRQERIRKAAICAVIVLAAYFAVLVIALQSRGAYAATTAALCVQLTVFLWRAFGWKAATRALIPVVIGTLLVLTVADHFGLFSNLRFAAKGGFVNNLVEAKNIVFGAPLLNGSLREDRLELLAIGTDLIRQRPWWGWGTDIAQLIQEHSPLSPVARLMQLHNGYLQTVVHFGLLGTVLLAGLVWSIVRSALQTTDDRLMPAQVSVCLAFVAFLLVFNFSETILFVSPAATIAVFLSAVACTREKQHQYPGASTQAPLRPR
jgi:O-antigen ligase